MKVVVQLVCNHCGVWLEEHANILKEERETNI